MYHLDMPSLRRFAVIPNDTSVPLRKLTLFSKVNLFLLHVFFSFCQWILEPFGLAVPVGTAFLASMFGFMIFVPPLVCWLVLCWVDLILPGTYDLVMEVKAYWVFAWIAWYLYTLATDNAPRTPVGANHRPPTNVMNALAHKMYYWNVSSSIFLWREATVHVQHTVRHRIDSDICLLFSLLSSALTISQ